jgi:hypothetical protein
MSIGSNDESTDIESKFNNESKDVIPENRTDSLENLSEDNKENNGYLFVGNKIEKSEQNKTRNSSVVKSLAVAGGVATGAAFFGINKLTKISRDNEEDEPSTDLNSETDNPNVPTYSRCERSAVILLLIEIFLIAKFIFDNNSYNIFTCADKALTGED